MFFIVIIGILAVIVLLVLVKRKKSENTSIDLENTKEMMSVVSNEVKQPTKMYISEDFITEKPVVIEEGEHITATLLMFEEDLSIWTCPSCEVENAGTISKCKVCGWKKQGG